MRAIIFGYSMNVEIPQNLSTASMSTALTMLCYFVYKGLFKGRFRSKCCRREIIDIETGAYNASLQSPSSSNGSSGSVGSG